MNGHLVREVSQQDHLLGSLDAPVTLVEYGDYQSPACGKAYAVIKRVIARMNGSICFVFRNFPLSEHHPMAKSAAKAAEAAALQGKFWSMHDVLYENQSTLSDEKIRVLASDLGLDLVRFEADWQRGEAVEQRVEQDLSSGNQAGVDETPGFFIQGERYRGSWSEDDLVRALCAKLRPGRAA
jgi:protein-disulfide isomerase